MPNLAPPVILTIAGSDSSAGAGLQADLKAIAANGAYGICALTAVVSEVPGIVSRVQVVDASLLDDQLQVLAAHYPLAAIKTGMLANRELAAVTADFLAHQAETGTPIVVDPVMVASSGDRLLDDAAIDLYRSRILPRASIATPNLAEAAVLLDREISSAAEMETAAHDFHQRYRCPVLVKGGHLADDPDQALDLLFDGDAVERFTAARVAGLDTHGTGCTLSAAIAARIGSGDSLPAACSAAKRYISAAIRQAHHWPQPGNIHALNHQPVDLQ